MRAALTRPDTLAVIIGVSLIYTLAYLYAIGYLFLGGEQFALASVADPVGRMFERSATFLWEPVARIEVGGLGFLFSPVNTTLGMFLGVLVGLNLGVAYLAWREPKACGIGAGSGFLAAIPALISGSACCAPVLLVVLGIQASGILLVAFDVALPLGILLLIGSLLYVGRMGAAAQNVGRTAGS